MPFLKQITVLTLMVCGLSTADQKYDIKNKCTIYCDPKSSLQAVCAKEKPGEPNLGEIPDNYLCMCGLDICKVPICGLTIVPPFTTPFTIRSMKLKVKRANPTQNLPPGAEGYSNCVALESDGGYCCDQRLKFPKGVSCIDSWECLCSSAQREVIDLNCFKLSFSQTKQPLKAVNSRHFATILPRCR
jgi:hypothetical protein